MKTKDRYERSVVILLAVAASSSLAVWAFEETTALIPSLGAYTKYASAASLALDACVLGIGLAMLLIRSRNTPSLPSPLVELISSAPVVILSSAPVLFAFLEGNEAFLLAFLLTARSLRILRLYRVLPGSSAAVLGTLAVCEILRSLAGSVLPDAARYASSLRLLLVPEAMLILGAAFMNTRDFISGGAARRERRAEKESQVGEEELAGLLGKKGSW